MANGWPHRQVMGKGPHPTHQGQPDALRLLRRAKVRECPGVLEPAELGVGVLYGVRVGRVGEVPWPGQGREGLRSLTQLLRTAGSTLLASACCPGVIGPPGLSHLHEPALGPQGESGSVGERTALGDQALCWQLMDT